MEGFIVLVSQALVAVTLTVIAWQDWTQRRIANWAVLVLLACAGMRWWAMAPSPFEVGFNLLLAALIAVPGTWMSTFGAGDTKLLFALAPLLPPEHYLQAFSFGILVLVGLCLVVDSLNRVRCTTGVCGSNAPISNSSHFQQLRLRGLPLGTAISIGWMTTLL